MYKFITPKGQTIVTDNIDYFEVTDTLISVKLKSKETFTIRDKVQIENFKREVIDNAVDFTKNAVKKENTKATTKTTVAKEEVVSSF